MVQQVSAKSRIYAVCQVQSGGKKHFLACYAFSICLKFCINTAKKFNGVLRKFFLCLTAGHHTLPFVVTLFFYLIQYM